MARGRALRPGRDRARRPRRAGTEDGELFRCKISTSAEEALAESKSKYYPISLDRIADEIRRQPGRGLFIGIPCFVKTMRNHCAADSALDARIAYFAGLVCGHLKTAQFAQNFAWQLGRPPKGIREIDFRHMPTGPSGPASKYFVRVVAEENGETREAIGQNSSLFCYLWAPGFFKYKACDYCDDVFAETADICFGDAWIEPYVSDQAELGHEASDPVTTDLAALASQLAPDLAHTVDREVALVHPLDLGLQLRRPDRSGPTVAGSWPRSTWRGRSPWSGRSARPRRVSRCASM